MPHESEPGDLNPLHPPLLRASEADVPESPSPVPAPEPQTPAADPVAQAAPPPAPPSAPTPGAATQSVSGEPPTAPATPADPPTPPLLPAGTPPPAPPWSPYRGAAPIPPVPPRGTTTAQPPWRRSVALIAVALMVLIAGALLGSSTRGGSLFSDSSSNATSAAPSRPSDASSVDPGGDNADTSSAARAVEPGIVTIVTTIEGADGQPAGQGAGTGMVISSSGEVLTNNHVIENAHDIEVTLSDGRTTSAKVVGYDVHDDVALLQLSDASNLDTIPTGDPSATVVNDPIVVIGNALGRGVTVTPGTVTGLDRQITATDQDGQNAETLTGLIQVEADVQPGDSGGALVTSGGEVIGMTSAASTNGFRFRENTAGIGFAIPIDTALSIAKQIRNGQEVDGVHVGARALLGVLLQSDGSSSGSRGSDNGGALVQRVTEDSPAADAGIEQGDVIVSVGDATIRSNNDLQDALDSYHPDEKVKVTWSDGSGNTESATVRLTDGPPA